jgi:hypothetical protein
LEKSTSYEAPPYAVTKWLGKEQFHMNLKTHIKCCSKMFLCMVHVLLYCAYVLGLNVLQNMLPRGYMLLQNIGRFPTEDKLFITTAARTSDPA